MQANRVRFQGGSAFHTELKKRVDGFFSGQSLSPRDLSAMYRKTAILVVCAAVCYGLLMFAPMTWYSAILLTLMMSFGLVGIAVAVQHDANHGGYSDRRWVNRLMGFGLDLVGGSSYVWHWKHNVVHHTFTNISGLDVDVDLDPVFRFSLDQRRRFYHRYQAVYAWFFYGLMTVKWHFFSDYRDLVAGHVGGRTFPRPGLRDWVGIVLGKVVFYGWALILPLMLHPAWAVIGLYLLASFVMGISLTVIFQLAHCVDEAEVMSIEEYKPICWAEHQIRTTANFAPDNPFLTWYLGGLNHQVEHHLFPKICHIHYPAISKIVSKTCVDFGIPYHAHPTFRSAFFSHVHRLWVFGRPETRPTLA